jgi:tetratricopeptide (TPR) repeat protein
MFRTAVLAAAIGSTLPQTAAQSSTTWAAVLDDYSAGRFEVVQTAPVRDLINRRAADYYRDATRWVTSGGAEARRLRERTSASLLLELLNEALTLRGASFDQLKKFLETYCELARRGPSPDAWTESWFAASVAVLAGGKDAQVLLDGERLQGGNIGCSVNSRFGHACHAFASFPQRTEFHLASITAVPVVGIATREPDPSTAARLSNIAGQFQEAPASEFLTVAAELLGRVAGPSHVRAEALLRRGVIALRLGRIDASLADFSESLRSSPDRFTGYLAHLYSGVAHELQNRQGQAVSAYRQAVLLNPQAVSGRVALAVVLFAQGHRDEAVSLSRETTLDGKVGADPWRMFSTGTFRHWPRYVRELRERLHP